MLSYVTLQKYVSHRTFNTLYNSTHKTKTEFACQEVSETLTNTKPLGPIIMICGSEIWKHQTTWRNHYDLWIKKYGNIPVKSTFNYTLLWQVYKCTIVLSFYQPLQKCAERKRHIFYQPWAVLRVGGKYLPAYRPNLCVFPLSCQISKISKNWWLENH
jgi:hypothetical protein